MSHVFYPFLLLTSVLSYGHSTIYQFSFSDFCFIPIWGYYEYNLSEHLCTSLSVAMFSFLLGKYLGVEMLGPRVDFCQIFQETVKLFSKVVFLFFFFLQGRRARSEAFI